MKIVVILNDIRSSENVGSIFRTADAVGASKIILSGYTPAPLDRFGRENKALTKASLGAEKLVEWERCKNLKEVVGKLKSRSFSDLKVIAVEQDEKAIDYRKLKKSNLVSSGSNIALVFGNEVSGLSKADLKLCDIVLELPMRGALIREEGHPSRTKRGKESLNVAVSAGIILFEIASMA